MLNYDDEISKNYNKKDDEETDHHQSFDIKYEDKKNIMLNWISIFNKNNKHFKDNNMMIMQR